MDARSTKADNLSGIHLWLVLWKASRAVETLAQRSIARYGMVQSDFGVLEALLHRGPLSAKQLGAKVLLTSGSVTAAIDRLAARGLVRRQDDAEDRRACIVHLTVQGQRLIARAFAQHRTELEEALEGFPVADRRTLLPLLRQLGRLAEEVSEDGRGLSTAAKAEPAGMAKTKRAGLAAKPGARGSRR